MAHSKEYEDFVLGDLKKYAGLMRPVKASLIERVLVRRVPISRLHPNPDDEFSMPQIGPNYGIVQGYVQKYIHMKKAVLPESYDAKIEPVIAEKMKPDGYMLLNGHHRWLAAHIVKQKKMPVKIVNATHVSDIARAMDCTCNRICVSFDLDEVLLMPKDSGHTEKKPFNPLVLGYRERVRYGVPALVDVLSRMCCDIWVYTGTYTSETYIRKLLKLYHIPVDGIVNGMKNGKTAGAFTTRFRERYDASVHVDADSVTCVDTKNKTWEITDLKGGPDAWASEAAAAVRASDIIKKILNDRK